MTTDTADHTAGPRTYAVVGATGQQGGATARALLGAGARVRALVRDPGAPAAQELARRGADLVRIDFDDPASLREAFTAVDGVFAMSTFAGERGTEGEVEQGRALGDAARDAGAPHVVFSSVGGAERSTGIPHFESKRRIEEHLEGLGLPVTFVRPVFFMDNFASFAAPQLEDGTLVLRLPLPAGVPLQLVAVDDIGSAAASALMDRSSVPGGSIELAGDELTGEQVAAVHGEVTGVPARYEALPLEALEGDADMQAMFAWFAETPAYQADLEQTRHLVPGAHDLRAWLTGRAAA